MYDNYIEELDNLIYEYTGREKKILKKTIGNLTKPGDNYCSLMLKIDVTLKNLHSNDEEMLHIVAKCRNKGGNTFFDQISPFQFTKEIGFYTEIVPALQNFQREQGLAKVYDIFPKVYAFRRNLHGNNDEIDEDAVILMENLFYQGYSIIDRQVGFNLDEAKSILKDLAAFHAVPVALKLLKPDVFESYVKKYVLLRDDSIEIPEPDFTPPFWIKVIENIEECKPYIENVKKQLKDCIMKRDLYGKPFTEPFATIAHNDLWTNNIMQKCYEGKTYNKIIDFQMYHYGNPLLDMVFLVFSSVQRILVKENFEDLVLFYESEFFKVLDNLKCDTAMLERNFMKQVEKDGPTELIHLLFMAIPIYGPKQESAVDFDAGPFEMIKESAITQDAVDHLVHVLTEFGKRGWISDCSDT